MKRSIPTLILAILILTLSSCLTVEKKVYTFELKDSNSGTITIKYMNILSMMDDATDVSETDFDEMISSYIEGEALQEDYPEATVVSKKLFEEDGVLCGEIVYEFKSLTGAGLYRYDNKSPYMFNIGSFLESENFLSSNGEYGGEIMPVVFWPKSLKTLNLTTYVTTPDESTISLLDRYNSWK